MKKIPVAMTIAGSDSGGGAGIEADLKTFAAFDVYGTAAITSVTAQNTKEVRAVHDIPAEIVSEQIDAVLEDISVNSVKTGMLSNSKIIGTVAQKIDEYELKVVVDPVMVTKAGDQLIKDEAVEKYIDGMVSRSLIITPNIREGEKLTGIEIKNIDDMKDTAKKLHSMGAENVVVKAGEAGEKVVDIFFDGKEFKEIYGEKFTSHKHGTGCTFSSAIAANLAKGNSIKESVETGERFIDDAIKNG
ncbi:MAG: bifunctional hydroxymethylpyrimidine kinase/phosphomethylpyrimidine kinase, partial [Candidatus Thermoplasmatota archaeon]|nr:bifunctional hydroxymethylpyrimidine kinase/phosphomethylpyrimidine kinase [Candidatus Thermoplasmatota archaeon]MBS3790758.1 bifunctional hydroxymethylpyrimidine kinase/phosphomethylpyrimidine kinase [Candidatus Thermoplasmatota archaeon]